MTSFVKIRWIARSFSTISSSPLRICVVGSGPAGFYTAEKLLKAHERIEVDIIDRLPTPFGLVRSGVAPDHPETKVVINQFSRVAQNERCSFFGNVSLGSSVTLPELRDLYNAVVLAYGAESDRSLGIPKEELAGIYAAREFVWWYNGHPDCRSLSPDLKSSDTAVILGQGNVALDVARILLRPTEELARTDIASHALAALEESSIRKVFLVGRRGPVQAACTAKELREILGIKDLGVYIKEADLVTTPTDEIEMKNSRIRRRVHELLSKAVTRGSAPVASQRELHFLFFRKPDRFLESDDRSGHVGGIRLEKTALSDVGDNDIVKQVAVGTGVYEDISCGLALKSIGYKSVAVDGLPFNNYKGIVPNAGGRVLADASHDHLKYETGLYVCGWLKRGPTGIIGTNLHCAEETLSCISDDINRGVLASASTKPGREGLRQVLNSRNTRVVPFDGWGKIDCEERRRGGLKNKPREKLTTWEELLEVACG
ncbi:NADPH:adrenodoxin oxidoreductase, mitochondrial isoform X2 [Salvia miltiorrhiza]|uniref:NADPH:adrenodoxin oxidoreductase, mitochondrial isoform X2 n=1 Tax=Salvia miltiorrhiza TaxID=226208 RepID=UPI0025ACCCD0|nr:NADPH:adrenodoxin oxidoreductase, mitochondrial isoform X2 [Salvia miltiorrhiza]